MWAISILRKFNSHTVYNKYIEKPNFNEVIFQLN